MCPFLFDVASHFRVTLDWQVRLATKPNHQYITVWETKTFAAPSQVKSDILSHPLVARVGK